MLSLENVTKSFDRVTAIQDISFIAQKGSVYGLLGPNGAGKTTTIRMIMNIIQPESGRILIDGKSTTGNVFFNTGYLPEDRGLYQKRNVGDVIRFFAKLKGLSQNEITDNCQYWLDRFNMTDQVERKISELSKGNQQKIQFIVSIISYPDLLILDEPFTGLDPVNQIIMKDIIREFRDQGKCIVLSTHQMDQVEQLCDHICFINKGCVIQEGPLESIRDMHGNQQIEIRYKNHIPIKPGDFFHSFHVSGNTIRGQLNEDMNFKDVFRLLSEKAEPESISRYTPSLEDIFIKLVEA